MTSIILGQNNRLYILTPKQAGVFSDSYDCYQTSHNHRSVDPWHIVNNATWATASSLCQRTVFVFQTVEKNMKKDQNWDNKFWLY